jgi:hypothetical protein
MYNEYTSVSAFIVLLDRTYVISLKLAKTNRRYQE